MNLSQLIVDQLIFIALTLLQDKRLLALYKFVLRLLLFEALIL